MAEGNYARVAEDQSDAAALRDQVFHGTASKDGMPDPYAPLRSSEDAAVQAALVGDAHPFSLQVGTPRVYRYNLAAEDRTPLVVTPTEEWKQSFVAVMRNWTPLTDDSGLGDEDWAAIEDKFAAEDLGEHLWRGLIDQARELAAQRGKAYFAIEGGLTMVDIDEAAEVERMDFATEPYKLKSASGVEVVGYLPGMAEAPREEDLVLYHGGQRGKGMVGLEYRSTMSDGGENLEPLPVLGEKEAIWAAEDKDTALTYSEARSEDCDYNYEESGGCEPHIYTIDATNAIVAEVATGDLTQRRANAVMEELLERQGQDRPDVLRLFRKKGGEEYFIPESPYQVTVVRVETGERDEVGWEIPPVQTSEGVPFAPPTEDFCTAIEEKGYASDQGWGEYPRDYWEDFCEKGYRPKMEYTAEAFGYDAENTPDDDPEYEEDEEEDDFDLPRNNPEVPAARQEYWAAYAVNKGPELQPTLKLLKVAPEKVGPTLTKRAKAPFRANYKPPRPGRPSKQGKGRGKSAHRPIAKIH